MSARPKNAALFHNSCLTGANYFSRSVTTPHIMYISANNIASPLLSSQREPNPSFSQEARYQLLGIWVAKLLGRWVAKLEGGSWQRVGERVAKLSWREMGG
jgi:hypothetical protein